MDPVVAGATLHHLTVIVTVLIALVADRTVVSLVVEPCAVWTQSFIVVPLRVPALPRRHSAAFAPDACHTHPGLPPLVGFGVVRSQTRRVVAVLTPLTLQQRLRMLVFPATHVAELAATAAPVLLVPLGGTLGRIEAEPVEGLAAHL